LRPQGAAQPADNPGGHGLLEAHGAAERDGDLAGRTRSESASCRCGSDSLLTRTTARSVWRILPHEIRDELPSVREMNAQAGSTVHDMAVGQHIAVGRKEETRATPAASAFFGALVLHLEMDDRRTGGVHCTADGARIGIEEGSVVRRWHRNLG